MSNLSIVGSKNELNKTIDSKLSIITKALRGNSGVTPSRFVASLQVAAERNPKIYQCTRESVIGAFFAAAAVGLVPDTPSGFCFLIPRYNSRRKVFELTYQLGYRGLIELADHVLIQTRSVHTGDVFEYSLGSDPYIKHTPNLAGEVSEKTMEAVWGVATLRDGRQVIEIMGKGEVDKIRKASPYGYSDNSPWAKWYTAMARKTVIKRLLKTIPGNEKLNMALDMDGRVEGGQTIVAQEDSKSVDETLFVDEEGREVNVEDGEIIKESKEEALEATKRLIEKQNKQDKPKEEIDIQKDFFEKIDSAKSLGELNDIYKNLQAAKDMGLLDAKDFKVIKFKLGEAKEKIK